MNYIIKLFKRSRKLRLKLRHFVLILSVFMLIFSILNLFKLTHVSWLIILLPVYLPILLFSIYLLVMITLTFIFRFKANKQLKKEALITDISLFCHKCAKPLNKPTKHLRNEAVYHTECKPKNF